MTAIVLHDLKRGIARNGDQPVHVPRDLRRFKALTEGKRVILGRKTAEVIGKPLPHRENWVITHDPKEFLKTHQGYCAADLTSVIRQADGYFADAVVIGGAQIYEELLPYCNRLHATIVEADLHCDQFFPQIQNQFWRLMESSDPLTYIDEDGDTLSYYFATYERVMKFATAPGRNL